MTTLRIHHPDNSYRCTKCKEVRHASEFRPNAAWTISGLSSWCKRCENDKARNVSVEQRAYREKLRRYGRSEKFQQSPVLYKLSVMMNTAECRAKKRGHPFDLDLAYLDENFGHITRCPILDIPINWLNTGLPEANSPSLDRLIPELGYVKGNVQLISRKANTMKTDGDLIDLMKFGEWATKFSIRKIAEFYINTPVT